MVELVSDLIDVVALSHDPTVKSFRPSQQKIVMSVKTAHSPGSRKREQSVGFLLGLVKIILQYRMVT